MSTPAGLGFARFLELRGHRVAESRGVLWHSVGFGLYMSLPYHLQVDLPPDEAGAVIRSLRAAGIRYPSRRWPGLDSGLYVCRSNEYGFHALHRNFRAHVKHGLPHCEIRGITESELRGQALAINRETMRRQGRYDPEFGDAGHWSRFVSAIKECPCIEPVGAFVDGRLASYAITCFEEGWLHILHKMNSFQFDDRHPSQVLDFTITRRIAADPSIEAVSMGLFPLIRSNPGLHDYKSRLGYALEKQSSVIRLHPALEWLATSRAAIAALAAARRLRAEDQRLEMAASVVAGASLARVSGRASANAGGGASERLQSGGGSRRAAATRGSL